MTSVFTRIGQDIDDLRDRLAEVEANPGGPSSGTYTHRQATAAATWTVTHNLGRPRLPLVELDSAPGELVWAEYSIINANSLTLVFDSPVTGYAYL